MDDHPPNRSFAIGHHLAEGRAWLSLAGDKPSSTCLSYAGFELRLALERLLLEYLVRADGGQLTQAHLDLARSFKRGENRLYQLEGHQRLINAKFRLFAVLAEMLALPFRLSEPDFGALAARWHSCSEFCHIGWTCVTHTKDDAILSEAHQLLTEIATYIETHLSQVVAWPSITMTPDSVEDRYVKGAATADELRAHFKSTGLWSSLEWPDGRKEFFGTAVPPEAPSVGA